MRTTRVASSSVWAIAYNRAQETLTLTFSDRLRMRYRYRHISPDLFDALMAAESIGKFYRANIRGRSEYPSEIVGSARRTARLPAEDARLIRARRIADLAHRAADGTLDARPSHPALAYLLFDEAVNRWGDLPGKVAARNAISCQVQMRYHERWLALHGIDSRVALEEAEALIAKVDGQPIVTSRVTRVRRQQVIRRSARTASRGPHHADHMTRDRAAPVLTVG